MLKFIRYGLAKVNYSSQFHRYNSAIANIKDSLISEDSKKDEPVDIANPFEKEKQKCILCEMNITPNYKNVQLLSQFQSPYTGRIYGRHITGLCKGKQQQVESAISRAQNCALMPGYHKDAKYLNEPKLFDPERPIRPHKY